MARTPSLNALRAFHAVAGSGSHAAAASELGVTISAISRQLKNLEECVGVALLVRNGRRMRLTADGRALQDGLEDAFAQIADAVNRLQEPMRSNRLRIMVPPMLASCWLVPRVERFNALSPDTEVILVDTPDRVTATNRFDLIVYWGHFEDDSTVIAERLSDSEEVFPVCRPGVCRGDGLAGADLLHYENVGHTWGWPGWLEFVEAAGLDVDRADLRNGPRLSPALLLDATRRGKGVMLASKALAHDDLASGRLVRPIAASMKTKESYWLLTARAALGRPEVIAFRSWLREEYAGCFDKRGALAA